MEKKTILLVEDDDVVRDLIEGALGREYNVLASATVSEASRLAGNTIDLALIDYMLPDGTGFDVLKVLREQNPELPVIVMTAYSSENLVIKAFRAGVIDYLRKPLSFRYLRGKLSEIFDGNIEGEHSEDAESRDIFIMDSIAAFIEDNYMWELDRDKLAEKACMDRYRFSRLFNERFGEGVRSYLNTVRVNKAAELLNQNPHLSVADIAVSVGYGNIVHFERVFKKIHGLSPVEYRRRNNR